MGGKALIWVGLFLGSIVGGYVPTLFGQDLLSGWSILWSTVGSVAGVYIGYKVADNWELM